MFILLLVVFMMSCLDVFAMRPSMRKSSEARQQKRIREAQERVYADEIKMHRAQVQRIERDMRAFVRSARGMRGERVVVDFYEKLMRARDIKEKVFFIKLLQDLVDHKVSAHFDFSSYDEIAEKLHLSEAWYAVCDELTKQCAICLALSFSQQCVQTSCGHYFHDQCLVTWLNTTMHSNTCPTCRAIIVEYPVINYALFFQAIREKNIGYLQECIRNKVNINYQDRTGKTALHLAASLGFDEIVRLLCALPGIDVNLLDVNRRTPLHLAAHYPAVLSVLLAHPAIQVNVHDWSGETALHLVVADRFPLEEVRLASLTLLLNHPSIVLNCRNEDGETPFHSAIFARCPRSIIQLLLAHGVSVNMPNQDGETPLHIAGIRLDVELVELLLMSGASKTSTDGYGLTPYEAVKRIHSDAENILRLLSFE